MPRIKGYRLEGDVAVSIQVNEKEDISSRGRRPTAGEAELFVKRFLDDVFEKPHDLFLP